MPLAVIEDPGPSPDGISTACLNRNGERKYNGKSTGERLEENWKRHFSLIRRSAIVRSPPGCNAECQPILVVTNFEIGRRIVEHEQQGSEGVW